ncbi:carbamoyltransferase [Algibacter miyuki]|uniref:Carbamoyltransferase n=1 Tax=Algibacter miyuki TaxID=1306933 RepID=A0ABV5GWL7_9FLAO|nr:carbamoyltransferase N-terminal domain-containing protein [Algibacter miyuki]MDN3664273.1 carbamoyltransferase N-terminal domain-containing protein [Algibacter miyuki]
MNIIGVSCFYHDSAACLLINGVLVSAAQEERFTRIKHDKAFPEKSVQFCLESNNLTIDDVDLIVFYEKPFLKFDRIINTLQYQAPSTFQLFRKTLLSWFKTKLWVSSIIKTTLNYDGEIIYTEHHESHAAGSFFTSPFEEAVIVTIDGVGEKACTTISVGKGNQVEILKEQHYPHSIGLLYSAFTQYCGFRVNSGEYKLMGLAPYGKPIYKDLILREIVSYDSTGLVTLNLDCFSFEKGESTINSRFCDVFKKPQRPLEAKMDDFYCDIASSIQAVVEDVVVALLLHAKAISGLENVCLSGGVALNCKANGELLAKAIFKNIWVQPASGDSGCCVGAAYVGWYHYLNKERVYLKDTLIDQAYLGSQYTNDEVERTLLKYNVNFKKMTNFQLCDSVSNALQNKYIVGWFQGKMEFGPRALGHRSILASPLFKDMKTHVNLNIKFREGFRPFAPIVLEEDCDAWFNMHDITSKYMLFTVKSDKKDSIPSCIHEDRTARVQTLNKSENPLLHQLIKNFKDKTECPVLINTSFNVRGEPIVESPLDALKCFFNTKMDVLVLENYVVYKTDNVKFDDRLINIETRELD